MTRVPEDLDPDELQTRLEVVSELVETLEDMGSKSYHFEGSAFVVTSDEDLDIAIRFESVRDEPQVSIIGDKIIATASRLQVVEGDNVRQLPIVDPIDITLYDVDTDELRERLGSE